MISGADNTEGIEEWAPISDLMAGLMLIFMFIAIIYIRTVANEQETNREECDKIYYVLKAEFGADFEKWNVELLKDLTVRFRNPDILFESEDDSIRLEFKHILRDFFPRYMDIVRADEYRDDIREIRIEGHTSSIWVGARDENESYFKNMGLSQRRTHATLRFVLGLPESGRYVEWAKKFITANGLSSSQLISTPDGEEDMERSRRVEFRLVTASCQKAGYPTAKEELIEHAR